jgi:hypothetical protein
MASLRLTLQSEPSSLAASWFTAVNNTPLQPCVVRLSAPFLCPLSLPLVTIFLDGIQIWNLIRICYSDWKERSRIRPRFLFSDLLIYDRCTES